MFVDQNINLVLIFNGVFVISTSYTCINFLQKNLFRLIRTAKNNFFDEKTPNLPPQLFSPNSSFIRNRRNSWDLDASNDSSFTEDKNSKINKKVEKNISFNNDDDIFTSPEMISSVTSLKFD